MVVEVAVPELVFQCEVGHGPAHESIHQFLLICEGSSRDVLRGHESLDYDLLRLMHDPIGPLDLSFKRDIGSTLKS